MTVIDDGDGRPLARLRRGGDRVGVGRVDLGLEADGVES
jgi:hypothetical protein